MQESINFLESEFDRGISDNYTLALVTYALSSVRSPKAKDALNMLTWRAEREGNVCNPFCIMKCVNDVRKVCTPGARLITFISSEWDENEMQVRSGRVDVAILLLLSPRVF